METHNLANGVIGVVLAILALTAARPILTRLMTKLYNLFIGTDHY